MCSSLCLFPLSTQLPHLNAWAITEHFILLQQWMKPRSQRWNRVVMTAMKCPNHKSESSWCWLISGWWPELVIVCCLAVRLKCFQSRMSGATERTEIVMSECLPVDLCTLLMHVISLLQQRHVYILERAVETFLPEDRSNRWVWLRLGVKLHWCLRARIPVLVTSLSPGRRLGNSILGRGISRGRQVFFNFFRAGSGAAGETRNSS